ncbi:TrlF family AAA-like ATPase [Heyndrickxia oleronia]|jgi:ABC-type cobalamin/Fe3+-siderophores transport system ATPase subunit|uniref:TrlF family AAA-like ATPase n=1 Tax=Heyndrickxia oleronia TaxID=38875 RepID=UPI00242CDFF0|nr:AAA family ATPase [Heyndrickxia oleronia]MCI1592038.1 AAA family ATPase [Heyndrickxia oleronia]MCI1614407.1 AAA family ATPase [Heyndrickxia oleronia]MCI1745482.1 AAA family ATPase [Heyndrickxia oleronia]MCI1764355.1 AAA family ATPase [Heyndrickxia oleronia]
MLSRGSTWSRWDLHIHTPYSIHNDYGGDNKQVWDSFIEHLENLPKDVDVIGINDYYFIDGFEKVMEYKMEMGRLQNIKKVFPLIEFRIDTFASASETKFQKVNLHVLFNIDDNNWRKEVKKIKDEFIQQINISPFHSTKSLSKESFIEIGGTLKNGFDSYVPSTDRVMSLIESEAWREKVFVLLGYKEWNNLEKGGQLKPFKTMLLNKADALFTASPSDDVSKKESVLESLGGSVLIHSQDIHRFTDLGNENYCCYTWIKADKTFEGLKQLIYEPKERIKIQQNNPYFDEQKSIVLDNVKVKNSNNWFIDEEIPLNSGLITIIGEKGAGKTALLDLLAIANEEGIFEPDKKNSYSFYNRAREEIVNSEVHIGYLGSEDKKVHYLDGGLAKSETNNHAKVRYLSLKELESYVDQKDKFQSFIKNIIHTKSPDLSKFEEKTIKQINKIQELNSEISELEEKVKELKSLEDAYNSKKIEIDLHQKNEPNIKTNFTVEQEIEYKKLITCEQELNTKIRKNKQIIHQMVDFQNWVNEEVDALKEQFQNKLQSKVIQLNNVDVSMFDRVSIDISIQGQEIVKEIVEKLEEENRESNVILESLETRIRPLEELNKSLQAEQKNTRAWIEKKSSLDEELNKLEQRKNGLDKIKIQILELQRQRKVHYLGLLEIKIDQRDKYIELKSDLESNQNIGFKVKIEFNSKRFLEKEDAIINHGSGNSQEKIIESLQDRIVEKANKINQVSKEEITTVIEFIDSVESENFISEVFGEKKNKDNLLKKSFSINDLYDWVFDDYFEVNYFIEYKGKPLEMLSPGQKGLVLMKVFLRLDSSSKPLLIDQPEDNLDNKSVFNDLVSDFREIKKKRQIIIATHNPNLVVNTDSEQVIVAKFEDSNGSEDKPKIIYNAGSLENNEIRKQVCEILEGGDTAFLKREKRYSLK